MSILDRYKQTLEEGGNMDFPSNSLLTEDDKEAYEAALTKIRCGDFSKEEIDEAMNNTRKNMKILSDEKDSHLIDVGIKTQMERITDRNLEEKGLLKSCEISDIKVIRAYCPKCGKELVSKAPPMFNPFTFEKVCIHECCGTKFNLDKTYPHIAYFDEEGNEINAFGM